MKHTVITRATEFAWLFAAFVIGAGGAVNLARSVRSYTREALEDEARGIDPLATARKAPRVNKP